LVTPRTLARLRLLTARGRVGGRGVAPPLLRAASGVAARGLRLSTFSRIYTAAAVLLTLALAYLLAAAQATQTSYELLRLRDQNTQLQAEQDQLRYQSVSLHAPARVEDEAAAQGMRRTNRVQYVDPPPVTVNLEAPVGPGRPDRRPLWRRAVSALFGVGTDLADALGTTP
jgi:cell division protein FtsL